MITENSKTKEITIGKSNINIKQVIKSFSLKSPNLIFTEINII